MSDLEVYHGDCFERLAELPDKSVDLILTDPPYGHRNNDGDLIHAMEAACAREAARRKQKGNKHGVDEARPIDNDGEEANDLVRRLFAEAARVLRPGCCCCCCGGGGPDPSFARWSLWMDEVMDFDQQIVWDKGPGGIGWNYRRTYEVVLIAHRKGAGMRYSVSKDDRLFWREWDREHCEPRRPRGIDTEYDANHANINNVIRPGDYGIRKITPTADQHPTQKPVALFEHFIRLHTKPGDLVVDPFCGSGASGVAAKKLGRRWIGCDTDERWVKMARERLAATTPPLPGIDNF